MPLDQEQKLYLEETPEDKHPLSGKCNAPPAPLAPIRYRLDLPEPEGCLALMQQVPDQHRQRADELFSSR